MLIDLLAKSLVKPERQPLIKNPNDYGMQFENVEFMSLDNIAIKGWLIPGPSNQLILMTHPMPFTRYGFSTQHQGNFKVTNQEVELLKSVKRLNEAGYNVLTIDLRNHGESGEANNGFCGVGQFEWQDIAGLMDYIETRDDLKTMSTGFFSLCTGANATIIAMSKAEEKFKKIKCMIAVQPISSAVFAKCIFKTKYPFFIPLYGLINQRVKKLTGYSLEELGPGDYVHDIKVPVMYVQVKNDPWSTHENIEGFFNHTRSEKRLLWLDGKERFDGYNYFGDHPEAMLDFFKKYM